MKKFLAITLLALLLLARPLKAASEGLRDSLQGLLERTVEPVRRLDVLLSMLDSSDDDEAEFEIAERLYREAMRAHDPFALAASLGTITLHWIDSPERRDSLERFLERSEWALKGSPEEGVGTYYQMVCRARSLSASDREKRIAACQSLLDELADRRPETPYRQAGRFFLTGCAHYVLGAIAESTQSESPVLPLEQAWDLALGFPPTARKNFCGNIYILLSQIYNNNRQVEKLIAISEDYISLLDGYFDREEIRRRRPYYNKDSHYLLCYQQLMLNGELIGRERAQAYYEQFLRYMQSGRGDPLQRDRYYLYSFSYNYHLSLNNRPRALEYLDSLLLHIGSKRRLGTQDIVYFKARARLLRDLKRYDEAVGAYHRACEVADSLVRKEQLQQIGELQVGYEVERLKLTTADLSARRHRAALLSSIGLLLLIGAFSGYTYRRLHRTQRLQRDLLEQRRLAGEAERKKTEFINSICHEVRTPLNCVYGFSELLYEEQDPLLREEYARIVSENGRQLSFMLNDLLEVTLLENLAGPLPLEKTGIANLLGELATSSETFAGGRLEYRVEGCDTVVVTNPRYLQMLVGCLLSNARKFTSEGCVSLCWRVDRAAGLLRIEVADTGCGIAPADRERIFGRFVKLDPYKPGNGLGLYLCRLIAAKLGGTVRVDGSYTGGTRMIVELPAEGPCSEDSHPAAEK